MCPRAWVAAAGAFWRSPHQTSGTSIGCSYVGDDHATLGQDQLDISQTEAEYLMQPDGTADDLGREAVPRVRGGGGGVIRSASPDSPPSASPS